LICDSQIHAPFVPGRSGVNGIDEASLLEEMRRAGVDRAILVPISNPAVADENAATIGLSTRHPDTFRVMGLVPFVEGHPPAKSTLSSLRDEPGVLGIRVSCYRDPLRSLLSSDRLDRLWEDAESLGLPVMILASGQLSKVARMSQRHPNLRIVVDHLGLDPFAVFETSEQLDQALTELVALASRPSIAVKASGIPNMVEEPWPFATTHESLKRILGSFGAERVFWGSDMTRLTCTYRECVEQFTEGLSFLGGHDLELVMGRAICDWLGWQ
jgi:L-fuconolactonase